MAPIYFISSDENIDLRNQFIKEHPDATYIEGFNANKIKDYDNIQLPSVDSSGDTVCNDQTLAHGLSHLKAIKTAYDNGDEGAFIMEDNVSMELQHLWNPSLEEIVKRIPEKCHCVTFQCENENVLTSMISQWIGDETLFNKWNVTGSGTGMYYITRTGMSRIIRLFYRKDKFNIAIRLKNYIVDGGLVFLNLNTYACFMPTIIYRIEEKRSENREIQASGKDLINGIIKLFYAQPNRFIKKFKSKYPCYYINMERCPERQAFIEKYFEQITRINAYDGKRLKEYTGLYPASDMSKTQFKPTLSQLGCSFSHIKMIKTAYDAGHQEALFFEDDMWPKYINKWKLTIDEIIEHKPKDTECLQFYCNNGQYLEAMIKSKSLYSVWCPHQWGAAAYYLNREGMKKIMEACVQEKGIVLPDNLPNYVADDTIIFRYLKTYSCNMPTFQGRMFTSTIHTCVGPQDNSSVHEPRVIKAINEYYST